MVQTPFSGPGCHRSSGGAAGRWLARVAHESCDFGPSQNARSAAIAQKLSDIAAGATMFGFDYDTGERYLSVEGFLPVE